MKCHCSTKESTSNIGGFRTATANNRAKEEWTTN
jgi:hypothetical protein